MLRRRPIARMAVRTTAVVGTAAVVGGHMANKQAQAAQEAQAAQAPAYAAPPPVEEAAEDPYEALTKARPAPRAGHPHRRGVRRGEGQDSRLTKGSGRAGPAGELSSDHGRSPDDHQRGYRAEEISDGLGHRWRNPLLCVAGDSRHLVYSQGSLGHVPGGDLPAHLLVHRRVDASTGALTARTRAISYIGPFGSHGGTGG